MYQIPEKNHLPPDSKANIEKAVNDALAELPADLSTWTGKDFAAWYQKWYGTATHTHLGKGLIAHLRTAK